MALELRIENQTLKNSPSYEYSINMNELNRSVISLEGNTELQNSLLTLGKTIKIFRDGVLDFEGKINSRGNFEGNAKKLLVRGVEEEYVKDNIDITIVGTDGDGIWNSEDSEDIFLELLDSGGIAFSAGTIETGINLDNKVSTSSSWFNGILNLLGKTGQEKHIDYINKKFEIYNSLGSDGVDTLNEGVDMKITEFQESEPIAKKILVYGAGDGINQYKATATAVGFVKGTDNVKTIRDPTIISDAEAQIRADNELLKSQENIETYQLSISKPYGKNYVIGDTLTINASSFGIKNKSVRIVRVIRGMQGDNEILRIEVTNASNSRTFKNATQRINENVLKSQDNETYEQGSGNTLTFGPTALNCNSNAPLRMVFSLPENFIKDETGTIRVNEFTVDYDIDPFRSGVGTAELTADGDIDGVTIDDAPPIIGETAGEIMLQTISSEAAANVTVLDGSEVIGGLINSFDAGDYEMVFIRMTLVHNDIALNADNVLRWRITRFNSDTQSNEVLITDFRTDWADKEEGEVVQVTYAIPLPATDSERIVLRLQGSDEFDVIAGLSATGLLNDHTHAAGSSLDAEDHGHSSGSPITGIYLDANSFNSDFTIGDDVSDAASLNATSVEIFLDWWNGSVWIGKNVLLPTGKTKDTGVDISDGGTYPDAPGFWRVRILPNSADSDLVIGSVNVKHQLEND